MTLRPCKCGKVPHVTEYRLCMMQVVEVKCDCGNKAKAAVTYIQPKDQARSVQAAVDGWNLG